MYFDSDSFPDIVLIVFMTVIMNVRETEAVRAYNHYVQRVYKSAIVTIGAFGEVY